MTDLNSFSADREFNPREYFPYGISRSGEFTCEQAELLISHGHAYRALAEGSREPVTQEEVRFVDVCRGKRDAETAHERAWSLFCAKVARPRPAVHSPLVTAGWTAVDLSAEYDDPDL